MKLHYITVIRLSSRLFVKITRKLLNNTINGSYKVILIRDKIDVLFKLQFIMINIHDKNEKKLLT
jgi:hypothetical protein